MPHTEKIFKTLAETGFISLTAIFKLIPIWVFAHAVYPQAAIGNRTFRNLPILPV
jgi:hypothetical protein